MSRMLEALQRLEAKAASAKQSEQPEPFQPARSLLSSQQAANVSPTAVATDGAEHRTTHGQSAPAEPVKGENHQGRSVLAHDSVFGAASHEAEADFPRFADTAAPLSVFPAPGRQEFETQAGVCATVPLATPAGGEPLHSWHPAARPSNRGSAPPASRSPSPSLEYEQLAETILGQWSSELPAALVFTSAAAGDGKTTTVARLAVLLAERAPGVLAVDANPQSPGLTYRFGIEAREGLCEVIRRNVSWREAVWQAPLDGLSILPIADEQPWRDETKFEEFDLRWLVDELLREHHLVLIDAPSMAYPAALPWARAANGAYLVVRIGASPRRAAHRSAELLRASGVRLSGAIVRG